MGGPRRAGGRLAKGLKFLGAKGFVHCPDCRDAFPGKTYQTVKHTWFIVSQLYLNKVATKTSSRQAVEMGKGIGSTQRPTSLEQTLVALEAGSGDRGHGGTGSLWSPTSRLHRLQGPREGQGGGRGGMVI